VDRCNRLQLNQHILAADIAGVKDQGNTFQGAEDLRPDQPVRV
jgi:hypothetical protein